MSHKLEAWGALVAVQVVFAIIVVVALHSTLPKKQIPNANAEINRIVFDPLPTKTW
jgi:hypothetical protein